MNFAPIVCVSFPGEQNSGDITSIKLLNALSYITIGAVKATTILRSLNKFLSVLFCVYFLTLMIFGIRLHT